MQSERGRITAALQADQLIGKDYSKLSLGVRSRYKAAHDSDALQCDSEPLVRHFLQFRLGRSSGRRTPVQVCDGCALECDSERLVRRFYIFRMKTATLGRGLLCAVQSGCSVGRAVDAASPAARPELQLLPLTMACTAGVAPHLCRLHGPDSCVPRAAGGVCKGAAQQAVAQGDVAAAAGRARLLQPRLLTSRRKSQRLLILRREPASVLSPQRQSLSLLMLWWRP